MRGPRTRKLSVFLAAGLITAAGITACSSGSSSTQDSSASQGPELTTITVETLDTPDVAEVWLAQKDGFFKQEGLDNVKVSYEPTTATALPGMIKHTVDFALENYVGAFQEQATNPNLQLRIVADDQQQGPNTGVILVSKNSKIKSVAQLKGKSVAFPAATFNLGSLELDEQLQGYGLGPGSYTPQSISFPNMGVALKRGEVSAAYSIQPFITIMESKIGAHPLIDLNTGATNSFPASGWATTAWFAQHYPRTVAAFQRAIEKGQQIAASDPALVRKMLPKYIPTLSPQIASVMALQTYNTTLSVTRLQRVATVMEQLNQLPKTFNVASMVVPLPPGA